METPIWNYVRVMEDNEEIGVAALEKGSQNEMSIIDYCLSRGWVLVKITKEEFDSCDGDEIRNH